MLQCTNVARNVGNDINLSERMFHNYLHNRRPQRLITRETRVDRYRELEGRIVDSEIYILRVNRDTKLFIYRYFRNRA